MGLNSLNAVDFKDPAILLSGAVDEAMYARFREQIAQASDNGLVVVELSTLGGDPQDGRGCPLS